MVVIVRLFRKRAVYGDKKKYLKNTRYLLKINSTIKDYK